MRASYAYVVSFAVIATVAYPAFLAPEQDSYPLSTYPMFSRHKPRVTRVVSAVAVSSDGTERAIGPSYIANAETMQAIVTLQKSLRAGPRATRALCRAIAARLASSGDADLAGASHVALISRTVDSIAYLAGNTAEHSRQTHVRCPVPETGS